MYFRNSACSQYLQNNRWTVSEPPFNELVKTACRWHYTRRMHIQSLLKRRIKSEIFSVWRKKKYILYPITFIHVEIRVCSNGFSNYITKFLLLCWFIPSITYLVKRYEPTSQLELIRPEQMYRLVHLSSFTSVVFYIRNHGNEMWKGCM